jgi:hypothetical protein
MMAGLVDSCVKQPEYSIIPHIDLIDITFRKGNLTATPATPDTLIFRFKFTDGDGDLGVNSFDSSSMNFYNPWYFVYNPTNFNIEVGADYTVPPPSGYVFINYKARKLQQFDTLPGINCTNWQTIKDTQGKVTDTIYMQQNLKAYNMDLEVYQKNNSGTYDKFDPATYFHFPGCNPNLFRGTFPDLSNDRSSPLDGVITFKLQSYGLSFIFGASTLKMDITIRDRALHSSNTIEKTDFTLLQITK